MAAALPPFRPAADLADRCLFRVIMSRSFSRSHFTPIYTFTLRHCYGTLLAPPPGIGISVGKISLYVGGGGFHPEHSLPVVLDVGCNREELREDKFYLVRLVVVAVGGALKLFL